MNPGAAALGATLVAEAAALCAAVCGSLSWMPLIGLGWLTAIVLIAWTTYDSEDSAE